ncbi:MAG TPA: c-type cytochrome [Vicinamibacteria bacterium]|nr:c-type cytochrome [Vicinamibacteria bacterium]
MSGRRVAALGAAAVLALLGAGAATPTPPRPVPPPVVVAQVPAAALPAASLAGGTLRAPLGEGGRLLLVSADGSTHLLTAGFDSAADPDVSFDGQSILFAAKKEKADPWCVWEMRADGSDARRITCGKAGARQPVYQSTIYTITPTNVEPWVQVGFVGTDPDQIDEAGVAPNTSLWSCKTDGSALRRLTYNLSNDLDPVILPDGRMVYAGWLRHDPARATQGRVALLGVNEDGTDYQTYAGEQGLRVAQMPAPTADGRVVFVESDSVGGDGAGRLAAVDQMRPLHTYQALSGDGDGLFRAPSALPDGRLLVSWRKDAAATFTIQRFDPKTRAREKVIEDPAWHSLQARLLAPRPMPDARSSVVREDDAAGKLYTIDVNIHDLGDQLPPGSARSLRVVEGVPRAAQPPWRRLLGTIPLAEDGSFQVQVPANTPVQLQLLDADGLAIRSSAWLWVRNHAAQGCVGCHEDPERTPPNRFVKAVQSPAPLLDQPPEKRRTVRYSEDVKPILQAKCLTCHGPGGQGPRLDGEGMVTPGEARRSRLMWHVLGRNTARPWDSEASLPGPKRATKPGTLSPDEVRALIEWIDLGGQP